MRFFKKSIMSACVALAVALLIPSMNVHAEEASNASPKKYTVTIRPGNVGEFVLDDKNLPKYTRVTKHGALVYEIDENGEIPNVLVSSVKAKEGYFVKNQGEWLDRSLKVDRNLDFVVDYGKIIKAVEYTIKYVDVDTKESIAPLQISQVNEGYLLEIEAPEQIVISGNTVYNLVSKPSYSEKLYADSSNNVFVFEYKMAPAGTIIDEVLIGENGQIITTTDFVTTTVDGGQAAGGAVAAAGGGAAGGDAGAGDAGGADEGGAVEIADEETPLAGSIDDGADDAGMVEIGEEEVPLASGEDNFANMAKIGAAVFAVGAVLLAGLWLIMKKKRAVAVNEAENE